MPHRDYDKKIYTILLTLFSLKLEKILFLNLISTKKRKKTPFQTFCINQLFYEIILQILVRKNFFRGAWLGKNPKTPKKPKRHPTLSHAFF